MKQLHLLLISFLLCSSFTLVKAQTFTVEGVIDTVAHAKYYVAYWENDTLIQDTIYLDAQNEFVLHGAAEEPVLIYLSVDNVYDEDIVGDMTCYVFWAEPGKTTYFEGQKGFRNQVVKNSVTESMSTKLERKRSPLVQQFGLLRKRSSNPHPNDRKLRDSLNKEYSQLGIEFIEEHPDAYYSAQLVKQIVYSDESFSPLGKTLFDGLAENIKATKMGKSISIMLENKRKIQIGEILPDFSMDDTLGNPVQLSRFRGKYVLIEFWASWCAPCRKENPNLVKAYQAYQPKGFEILSVSLDDEKKHWLEAIKDDKLEWNTRL